MILRPPISTRTDPLFPYPPLFRSAVCVAVAFRLAQAHAVDYRAVVERVGDDRVALAQQRLEQAAVGIEAGGVEDRVFGAEELGDGAFQLLVQILGAADEAHRSHAEAVRVQRVLGCLDPDRKSTRLNSSP